MQLAPERDDGRGHRPVVSRHGEIIDERLVDLELADWQAGRYPSPE
jgi:hypothetical protein